MMERGIRFWRRQAGPAGAAGAMSYEWGVVWLTEELDYTAQPLRESVDTTPDPQ